MIQVFYGDDRVRLKKEIVGYFGTEEYEVIDSVDLTQADLPNIFKGASLFESERKVLLRDFTANKDVYEKLTDYLDTPHKIALFETKVDKRSTIYKELKDKIKFVEYNIPSDQDFGAVFNIYKTAKRDGKKAVKMLEDIKLREEPIMFFGLLVSQAMKDFEYKQGIKEKRVLLELSKLDIQMKTSAASPWLLIESFLLRLSSLLLS